MEQVGQAQLDGVLERRGCGVRGSVEGLALVGSRTAQPRGQAEGRGQGPAVHGLGDTTWEHVDSEFCVFFLLVRKQAHPREREAETGRQVLPGAGGPETVAPGSAVMQLGGDPSAWLRSSPVLWPEWFCTPTLTPSCFLLPLLPPTPCPCPGAARSLGARPGGEKLAAEASSLPPSLAAQGREVVEGGPVT